MRLEHPFRREMRGADQPGFVRVIAHRNELDGNLVRFKDHRSAPDNQFANPARAEPATDHDALGILPALQLEIASDHQRELLRKVLDCTLHDASRLGVALGEQAIELLLGDLVARRIPERVVTGLTQVLSPILDHVAERTLAGAIADEALVILQFDVVAVDRDRRQPFSTVCRDTGECIGVSHEVTRNRASELIYVMSEAADG